MTLLSTVITQCPTQGLAQKRCPVGHEVVAIAMWVSLDQQLVETEAGKSHALGLRAKRPPEAEPLPKTVPASNIGPPRVAAHLVLLTEGIIRQSPRAKQTLRSPNFPLP